MSNNISPIEISHDDRRFVVFKAYGIKPNSEYFKKLVDLKNNKDDIKTLYEYFKNFKINLNLREDRPKTQAYLDMKDNNINPLYKFLHNIFIKDEIDEYFIEDDIKQYKKHKKLGILIQSNIFYENYRYYLEENNLIGVKHNITQRTVKTLLTDMGIIKRQVKINNQNKDYYCFNVKLIEQFLSHMNLDNEDDILILNDEDFID